jgi:acetoin utilization deacetylase AcuC-like enzyme
MTAAAEEQRGATWSEDPSEALALPVVHHPGVEFPGFPADHPFPMGKFAALRRHLLDSGLVRPAQFRDGDAAPAGWLALVHSSAWIEGVLHGTVDPRQWREVGLPWSPELVRRSLAEVGSTVTAARLAWRYGLAVTTSGGTHHAHRDHGAGYCVFNDLAVAARVMLDEGRARRIAIIDVDVHQGDGTNAIFANDPAVVTFSLHCADNYPLRKVPARCDISVPEGTGDADYLAQLLRHLEPFLERERPDLVIYDAGTDPHADDRLGKLRLSDAGLAARDRRVLNACRSRNLGVAAVIGGGYDTDLSRLARRHAILHRVASEVWSEYRGSLAVR